MKRLRRTGRVVIGVDDFGADVLIDCETINIIAKPIDIDPDVAIDARNKLGISIRHKLGGV
jgi:hypothetical protein